MTPKNITRFEIKDHGIDNAQYFRGCGVSRTDFTDCATGVGDNPSDALCDALECLAMNGWDVSAVIDSHEARMCLDADGPSASSEVRAQLEADNPQGKNESDSEYAERIDECSSDTESELFYYVSIRVTNKTNWDETPDGFIDYVLPSHWASYLINGDDFGLEVGDKAGVDAFFAKEALGKCVDCSDESFFTHFPDSGIAGDCLRYRFQQAQ